MVSREMLIIAYCVNTNIADCVLNIKIVKNLHTFNNSVLCDMSVFNVPSLELFEMYIAFNHVV